MGATLTSNKTQSMTTWEANSQQIYGSYACTSGYPSPYRCGPILGTDLTENVGGLTEYHMWQADFRSTGGDSGGPVFNGYIEQGIADAIGGVETYYSTIYWIDYVMGTTPCLSASC